MPSFVSALKLNKIPVTGLVPESSGTAPTSPVNGQIWVDTSVTPKLVKTWDGSAWAVLNVYAGTTSTSFAAGDDSRITGAVQTSTKNAANGVAGLDSGGRIAAAQLPSVITAAGQTGAATTVRFVGGTGAAAAPASGTFNTGDVVVGTDGSVYVCTSGGTPGTWRRSLRDNELGVANGIATLDGSTKIPIAQIPTGQTGSTVPLGNDARFTDTRTPTAGSVVDASVAAGAAIAESKLSLASDAAAGTASRRTLGYSGNAAMPGTARLDQIAAPTAAVGLNGQKITNLGAPTANTDAARLVDVQGAAAGIDAQPSVRAASTANLAVASAVVNGAVVDGVTLATGDRILLKNQTTASENGTYIVAASGAAARTTDNIGPNTFWFVEEGSTQADTQWVVTTNGPITLGTTSLVITQFGAGTNYVGTANRLTVTGNTLDVAPTYVGQTSITTVGTITSGTWNGTDVAVADGGTGASTAAAARTNLGAAQAGYQALLGALSAGTPLTVTHNLNTDKCIAQVRDATTGEYVYLDIIDAPSTPNTLTVTSAIAYAANALDIVVVAI